MKLGSLFSGYGGLEMAVENVLGTETAWVSDIDKGACKILAHRYPDVPNLGDITAVDWSTVEPVDVITGGSPCQDLSHAGKRSGMTGRTVIPAGQQACGCQWADHRPDCEAASPKGLVPARLADDADMQAKAIRQLNKLDRANPDFNRPERTIDHGTRSNLWVTMREAIAQIRPSLVVWENVRGAYSAGADSGLEFCAGCMGEAWDRGPVLRALGRVLGDLSDLAYDARVIGLRAADVGAPHGRFRVFVVAYVLTLLPTPAVNDMGEGKTVEAWDAWTDAMKAKHGNGNGHGASLAIEAQRLLPTPSAQNANGSQTHRSGARTDELLLDGIAAQNKWGDYADAIARWEHLTRPAPAPTMQSKKDTPQLSPAFSEWMMGLPAGWVTDVPDITRNEALRALGNGVVPQQAEHALRWLLGGAPVLQDTSPTLLPTPKATNNENRQSLDRYGMNLGQALGITPLEKGETA
jgi:DNA (cytosine-5)-methyltransferase 1